MQRTVAVEDPIHSLFDLADHATREAPQVRAAYRHSKLVIGVELFFIILGDIGAAYVATVGNHLIFIAVGILTLIVLYVLYVLRSLYRADDLIERFFEKLRAIDALERTDAEPKIPEGAGPLERYARYVWKGDLTLNPTFPGARATALGPKEWSVRGRTIRFDLAAERPGSWLYRLTGLGDSGNLLLVRQVPTDVNSAGFESTVADVQAVASAGNSFPSRLVLLRGNSDPLPDDLYARITRTFVPIRYRLARKAVPVQVVSERKDGNYDFTPYLISLP